MFGLSATTLNLAVTLVQCALSDKDKVLVTKIFCNYNENWTFWNELWS